MKFSIEIPNEQVAQKVVWFLEHLKSEGVIIIEPPATNSNTAIDYTDEYIAGHWRDLIITGLANYDGEYYKSDRYKEDRGAYLMEKYK
jgi:hypothetical protein